MALRSPTRIHKVVGAVRSIALVVAALAGVLPANAASADGLSKAEMHRLLRGESVERSQSLTRSNRRYVGGLSYVIVDAGLDELSPVLSNVETWRRILPRTRSARRVGEMGQDVLLEVSQGSALLNATYTMRVHREEREVRFWMDPERPHDIEDAWGFLRAEPLPDGRTLVTYGVLIDMGPGLLRDLFEGTVRHLALSVPERVREYVEGSASSTVVRP